MKHTTQSSSNITLRSFLPAIVFWMICQTTFLIGCNDVQWVPPQKPDTTIEPTSELQPAEPDSSTVIPINGIVTPSPPSTFSPPPPPPPSRHRFEYTEEFSFQIPRGNLAIVFLFHPESYILDNVFRNLIVPDPYDYSSKSYAQQFTEALFGTENEYKGIHLYAAKNSQPLNGDSRHFLNTDKFVTANDVRSFLERSYYNLSIKQQNSLPSTPLSTMLDMLTTLKFNILNYRFIEAYDKPYNLHIIYFRSESTRNQEAEETSKRADEWRRAVGEPPFQANRTWIHMMLARDPARPLQENHDRLASAFMKTSPTLLHNYRSGKDFVNLANDINQLNWKMVLKRQPIENTIRVQINGQKIDVNHFHVSPHPPEIIINMPPGQEPVIGDQIRVIYEFYSN